MQLLNLLKPHKSTRFTLKVTTQSSQRSKLLPTSSPGIRTMVNLLLMGLRVQVLIQRFALVELPVAKVALPVIAVPRAIRGFVLHLRFVVPSNLLIGDDSVRVGLSDHSVDRLAVQAWGGFGARTGFEVVAGTAWSHKGCSTEWAQDIVSAMYSRVEMLEVWLAVEMPAF